MRLILEFMLPLLFGLLFQQFYNLVDTIVVGKYLGVDAFAGVGSTGSINFLVLGFCIGICTGIVIPVAQKFGQKDEEGLRRFVGNIIWVAAVFAVVICVVVSLLCGKILTWMNTPQDVFQYAYDYIFVIFLGIPVLFLYNTLSGIIRSMGDSRTPVVFLVLASLLNVVLDLAFIVGIGMGVAGAAWATIISQLVSGLLCLFYVARKFQILRLTKKDLRPSATHIRVLCGMGVPMGLQYSITAIGSILIQSAVNGLEGGVYVAAVAAGVKVNQVMFCPFDAMGSTMATYGGQNIGAGRVDRIGQGLRACGILGVAYALAALAGLYFFADKLILMFMDAGQVDVIDNARRFLLTGALFYIPLAFVNIVRFLIQGLGYSNLAVLAGVFEMAARGTVALWLVPALGYQAVCFANPAAWVAADIFLFPAYVFVIRRLRRRYGQQPDEPALQAVTERG